MLPRSKRLETGKSVLRHRKKTLGTEAANPVPLIQHEVAFFFHALHVFAVICFKSLRMGQ
jgi:hypothetical protein